MAIGDRIHREFYRADTAASPPRRYGEIVRSTRTHLAARSPVVVEIGPERAAISKFVIEQLGIPPSGYLALESSAISAALLRAEGISVEQVDVSSDELPVATGSVDAVIAGEVLEHLMDPERLLRGVRRILRPGGILVCTTPNLAAWFNRLSLLVGFQPVFTENGGEWVYGRGPWAPRARPVGHVHVATLGALTELFALQGFEIVAARGLPSEEVAARGRAVGLLDSFFARVPTLAADLLIVARPRVGAP